MVYNEINFIMENCGCMRCANPVLPAGVDVEDSRGEVRYHLSNLDEGGPRFYKSETYSGHPAYVLANMPHCNYCEHVMEEQGLE